MSKNCEYESLAIFGDEDNGKWADAESMEIQPWEGYLDLRNTQLGMHVIAPGHVDSGISVPNRMFFPESNNDGCVF